eukprot:scaffold22879_cov92-Isochrysis_galbana.AAC.3
MLGPSPAPPLWPAPCGCDEAGRCLPHPRAGEASQSPWATPKGRATRGGRRTVRGRTAATGGGGWGGARTAPDPQPPAGGPPTSFVVRLGPRPSFVLRPSFVVRPGPNVVVRPRPSVLLSPTGERPSVLLRPGRPPAAATPCQPARRTPTSLVAAALGARRRRGAGIGMPNQLGTRMRRARARYR